LVTDDGRENLRTPTVPIQSKVGAGDSTVAGVVLALVRGMGVADAVRFGMASGAAAVMTPGTELCRRDDAERLFQKMRSES
jgi:6-phosphofructokinase 2